MSNKVCGRVLLKETGVGIPDLLIEVYDVDPNTRPEEIFGFNLDTVNRAVSNPQSWEKFPADRLGCVPTDENGQFELTYEDGEFQIRNEEEKRPDLLLFVMAPEDLNTAPCPQILHISCGIRRNAGRIENYIIRLTAEQLKEAGVSIPQIPNQEIENPTLLIDQLNDAVTRQDQIQEGVNKLRTQRVTQERQRVQALEKNFETFIQAISTIPADRYEALNYVRPGESVEAVNQKVIADTITNKINNSSNRAPILGHILLTEAQKEALKPFQETDGKFVDVPSDVIAPILFGTQEKQQRSTFLVHENPLGQLCRQKIAEEKHAEACLGLTGEHEHHNDDTNDDTAENDTSSSAINANVMGNGVEPAASEDIPKYIARFMGKIAAPEEPVAFWVTGRANQQDVQDTVKRFELKGGPADALSYHDFHNLQIAFEHVWQEAIDQGVLDIGKDLYEQIVELGGNPNNIGGNPNNNMIAGSYSVNTLLDALRREARSITSAQQALAASEELYQPYSKSRRSPIGSQEPRLPPDSGNKPPPPGSDDKSPFVNATKSPGYKRVLPLLTQLENRLKEDYAFTIYAANRQQRSVNFGILVTYRQKWEPISYQAGELVKTIPLTPKEVRKFSTKTVVKKRRAEKEVENNLNSRKEENSETSRAEQEILRKAETKTNFSLTSIGTFNAGIKGAASSSGSQTTTVGGNADKVSQEVKKDFREAVFKAAQEYKQERTLEINTEESEEFESQESGEISNPNDELAVTFLFYELQHRYRVSEHIHRLTPVVLVAQEVPNPADIDEDWLIAHDWILRRTILDDSFIPALTYVSARLVGDEQALAELQKTVEQQRRIVEELKEELGAYRKQVGQRYVAMEKAIAKQAGIVGDDETLLEQALDVVVPTSVVNKVTDFFGFGGSDEGDKEAARIRREAAESAYERAVREEREVRGRLDREITALNSMTETYAKTLSEHLNRKVLIARLKLHIKQNILYYMQAIWSHESPDHCFFRLHKVSVPVLEGQTKYTINALSDPNNLKYSAAKLRGFEGTIHSFEVTPDLNPEFKTVTLAEVADLDNLLGFKGNYMMFPLKQSNALTDFMMAPYIDNALGTLIDPDELGNWTLEDFAQYICCLKETLPAGEFNDELKAQLREQYKRILTSPRRSSEEIIVPTGSLFIEALPGKHPILEDFKLMHRAIDVKKVQAEVRKMELENIRAAARLLTENYEDPDIDRKYVFEGDDQGIIIPVGSE